MKTGVIIPIKSEYNFEQSVSTISDVCNKNNLDYNIIFAFDVLLKDKCAECKKLFAKNKNIQILCVDLNVSEYDLITVSMQYCENFDATIIYSGKNIVDANLLDEMLKSWKAGNKIVYIKQKRKGFKKIIYAINSFFYKIGVKLLKVFNDHLCLSDIQLLDYDVVKTINKLPTKNRQLRVFDSFVGFASDTILADLDMENKDNNYNVLSKDFYNNLWVTISMFFSSLVLMVLLILSITLKWETFVAFQFIMFLVGVFVFILGFIYYTKTMLSYRVGEKLNDIEYKNLFDKTEIK